MDFKDLQRANDTIKPTDIGKGKEYAEVNQRIKAFRMLYPEGRISTDMISLENGVCIFKAIVSTPTGEILGTGTAYEKEGSSFINKTSYIENCETSAVGRALAMCGIGIDTSIASFEEVANAIENQKDPESKKAADATKKQEESIDDARIRATVLKYCNKHYTAEQITQIANHYGKESVKDMSTDECKDYLNQLKAKGKNINE